MWATCSRINRYRSIVKDIFGVQKKKTDFRDVSTSAINGQIEEVLGKRE